MSFDVEKTNTLILEPSETVRDAHKNGKLHIAPAREGNNGALIIIPILAAAVVISIIITVVLTGPRRRTKEYVLSDELVTAEQIAATEESSDSYTLGALGEQVLIRDTSDDYVNLRKGPGTEYDVLTQIPNGAWAHLTGDETNSKWTMVTYNGTEGWVYSSFVYELEYVVRNYDSTGCNVRQGPGTDYDIIGYLYNGTHVYAADVCDEQGWFCISYNGEEAWVSGGFLHGTDAVIYNADNTGANLRSEPGTDCDILAYLKNGTEVSMTDTLDVDGWVCVEVDGMTGWVYKSFVQ